MKPVKFLTKRTTVIFLLAAITVSLLAANIIPQRTALGGKPPAWLTAHPETLRFITLLQLDNIVGSAWFALLVVLFEASLVVSTISQFTASRMAAGRIPSSLDVRESRRVGLDLASFSGVAAGAGFHPAGSADGVHRFVKHRSGYWGNFLLHLGLVTTVFFCLVYVLTQHRTMVRLVEKDITRLTPESVAETRGLRPLHRLPDSVTLNRLVPTFWGNDKLESLSSELYFTDVRGNQPRRVDVAISDKSRFDSFLIYQGPKFGLSFDLDLVSTATGAFSERLYLHYPARRDLAGYGEIPLEGTGFVLKGKFSPDARKETIQPRNPLLTLRLFEGNTLRGEASLKPGGRAQIGPFQITLSRAAWWTDILLDGSYGISGIFAGFALILLGVLSSYCLVPRELLAVESQGALSVQYLVRRFGSFYREEFDTLIGSIKETAKS